MMNGFGKGNSRLKKDDNFWHRHVKILGGKPGRNYSDVVA